MNHDRLKRLDGSGPADLGDLGQAIIDLAVELVDAIGQDPESVAVALLLMGGSTKHQTRFDASVN
jgi:hypothetical protein